MGSLAHGSKKLTSNITTTQLGSDIAGNAASSAPFLLCQLMIITLVLTEERKKERNSAVKNGPFDNMSAGLRTRCQVVWNMSITDENTLLRRPPDVLHSNESRQKHASVKSKEKDKKKVLPLKYLNLCFFFFFFFFAFLFTSIFTPHWPKSDD